MEHFARGVVKSRYIILIISIILLIPAAIGYFNTKVNYDLLYYLPDSIDTMKGQEYILDDFHTGAFGICMVKGLSDKKVSELKKKIEKVDHVEKVIWYDSIAKLKIPKSMIPKKVYNKFNYGDSTIMMIMFNDTSSADNTLNAINEIRTITKNQCKLTGISAIVNDTKILSEQETPIYVGIAILISVIILSLLMDSWLIPFFFLASIGMAIIYNLGSNFFFGQISYVTKALAAVLQLAVTMDYSIFLWHSYEVKKDAHEDKLTAMIHAIRETISSVVGSSVTTIAGFIALCFMTFTLGLDLGIVMAKGVLLGVISCVTILPSMILVFDKAIEKTRHKQLLPDFKKIPKAITKHYWIPIVIFVLLIVPAVFGYKNTNVYYDLSMSLPDYLESVDTQKILNEKYKLGSANIILVNKELPAKKTKAMLEDIKKTEGVSATIGMETIIDAKIPQAFIPEKLTHELVGKKYEMLIFMSQYKTGSDRANKLSDDVEKIIKKYDKTGMLVGEAACTRDLINITNIDFKIVSAVSIVAILIIIALVFRSISIPIILVALIEFGIFINLGIPYYTHTTLPFVASIVIGTIQLGATVDYAILMTNRYRLERSSGKDKKTAARDAMAASMKSVIVSALTFFGATIGVGIYSSIDMISSLCTLMARGALISMLCVICILPAFFILTDKFIVKGSYRFLKTSK